MKKLTAFSVRQADRYLCFFHSNYDFHMVIANLMYSLDSLGFINTEGLGNVGLE